ncbi:MAG TPA: hypothetical protein PKY19_01060 [Oscillospiraceae bacterium]|nr:hypothetical protein [Oscillospiraceae bacterium]
MFIQKNPAARLWKMEAVSPFRTSFLKEHRQNLAKIGAAQGDKAAAPAEETRPIPQGSDIFGRIADTAKLQA